MEGCFLSGEHRAEGASVAAKPSLGKLGWHSHHVIPKVLGGSDGVMNRQLLHPVCHRQLHSNLATSAFASLTRVPEGLSRVRWKLSRTVLRGAVGGDADCLLDKRLDAKTKQPYAFKMTDGAPFAFAGLWDAWREPDGGWLQSFSIVTTEANELMSPVHTRMPVILHPRDYSRWLDRDTDRPPIDLLRPFESELMAAAPCNPLVGNVRNNGPEMLNSA